ncbi:MAG: sulfotransferase, partial [Pirellulales bacterium]
MNGHSNVERLACGILDFGRRLGTVGDEDDAPIFVFAAGPGSGEHALVERLARPVANEALFDRHVIASLAWQLVNLAGTTPKGNDAESASARTRLVRRVARVQAAFVREACQVEGTDCMRRTAWRMMSRALTGEEALYLRLIFPRAKFIFLHRHPVDAFSEFVGTAKKRKSVNGTPLHDSRPAGAFAEQWCHLVASFELWRKDVGGILIGHHLLALSQVDEVDAYLGERLLPRIAEGLPSDETVDGALHEEDVALIVERTAE